MEYSKPVLVNLGSTANIKGTKVNGCIADGSQALKSCDAYEADE